MAGTGESTPRRGEDGWGDGARLTLGDLVAMIWRERAVGLIVSAVALALGLSLAFLQRETFTAESRLLVRIGPDYVYDPAVGAAGAGASPMLEEILNAEAQLLVSPEVARRTVARLGVKTLYPGLARAQASKKTPTAVALAEAGERMAKDLHAEASPRTPVLRVRFSHRRPEVAADGLNAYVAEYLDYRRSVLANPAAAAFAEQGAGFQDRLGVASEELRAFLAQHRIGDFEVALKTEADIQARIAADLVTTSAERRAVEGQAAALRARVASEPGEIELFSESEAAKQLVALEVERAQLLAKFETGAPPLVEVERRIAQLRALLEQGARPGLTRRGPNPVRQDLERQLYTFEAQARALAARETALGAQAAQSDARLRELQALTPRYRELARGQSILEENARAFAARAEVARASEALVGLGAQNIRIAERASAPTKGESLRLAILALSLALAGVLGLAAALARGLWRDAFPTAASAERTLGAPVLGMVEDVPTSVLSRKSAA